MDLKYRENYWDRLELKKEFIRFLTDLFDLDLSEWDRRGFWDNQYRPFSYFHDDKLVSNVCVYSMDMTIQGKQCHAAQISAVGTLPEYRRKGLSQALIEKGMDWARDHHDCCFLFADEGAHRLYEKCGFQPADEYKACIPVQGHVARPGTIRLDIGTADQTELVYRLALDREPVSDLLGVSNERLLMFWCLYALKDYIYYVPDLDVLVIYRRDNGLMTVFDIVGRTMPTFAEIYPYVCDKTDRAVEFLFMVDKLDLASFDLVRIDGNGTHVLSGFPLEGTEFTFPFTAHA